MIQCPIWAMSRDLGHSSHAEVASMKPSNFRLAVAAWREPEVLGNERMHILEAIEAPSCGEGRLTWIWRSGCASGGVPGCRPRPCLRALLRRRSSGACGPLCSRSWHARAQLQRWRPRPLSPEMPATQCLTLSAPASHLLRPPQMRAALLLQLRLCTGSNC